MQNFKKVKNIKISAPLHDQLSWKKYLYKCNTFEWLFRKMIDEANVYEAKEKSLKEREEALQKIEKKLIQKNDLILKRLSYFEHSYFSKIDKVNARYDLGVETILRVVNKSRDKIIETQISENISTHPDYLDLKKQYDELWNEQLRSQNKIQNLEQKIRQVSQLFEKKSTLISTHFEAKIQPDAYQKIFG